jgi:hypothetical protein
LNLAHSLKMVRNSVLEYKIFYLKMWYRQQFSIIYEMSSKIKSLETKLLVMW